VFYPSPLFTPARRESGAPHEDAMEKPTTGGLLTARHVIEYPYRRSLGPVLSRFFTGLRDRRIEGVRTESGRVLVPPSEYDPDTGDATTDFVEVGPGGVVRSWAWVHAPRAQHPLDHAFAFALIQLDGADTCLVHAVDPGKAGESGMSTGLRVTPAWADETIGQIQDIRCFVPEGAS
jgi:uncharacterized OB-fold protein